METTATKIRRLSIKELETKLKLAIEERDGAYKAKNEMEHQIPIKFRKWEMTSAEQIGAMTDALREMYNVKDENAELRSRLQSKDTTIRELIAMKMEE